MTLNTRMQAKIQRVCPSIQYEFIRVIRVIRGAFPHPNSSLSEFVMTILRRSLVSSLIALAAVGLASHVALAAPIVIAEVNHDGDVDFEKEILPIFRRNCLACHSATEAQSDLVLESPQTILKGGSEGPAVVAGKSAESRLLQLASKQKEPFMPPPDNDVKAKPLTPQELGLIKLWIDQGAKGEVHAASTAIAWQPLPPGINPIYSVAITPDGQYAAASRANQIFLYHVPSKRELGRLTDPSLLAGGIYQQPGVADLDLVQSLKFSPDGSLLASGGFRTVKMWRKPATGKQLDLMGLEGAARALAMSSDGKLAAIGEDSGKVKLFDLASGKVVKTLTGHSGPVASVVFTSDGKKLVTGSHDKTFRIWSVAAGEQIAAITTPSAVNAVALVAEGRQIATGGEDNVIRLWEVLATQPDDAAKPVKELSGHGGPVTSLVALAPGGTQLVSGSKDGTIRVWDLAAGTATKNMNHGTPVESVAATADGQRLASVSSASNAKLWNVESGQQTAELKGDIRATLKVGELTRAAALAKKHIDLAKKDLEEANNRKKAEDDNQKKSAEALTKADAEIKPKDEAAKKATDEKSTADKALADATAAKTRAEEGKKAAEDLVAKADEAIKSVKSSLEATAKLTGDDAAAAKTAAEKAVAEVEGLRKLLEPAKQSAAKSAEEAVAAFTAAEKKVKDFMPTFQKAIDEQLAAQRTLDTSKRGAERAGEAVKKATEAIPGVEAIVTAAEETAKQRGTALAQATTVAKESEKPLKGAAFSPSGAVLLTVGDDGLAHSWDVETGVALEVYGGAAAGLSAVAFTPSGQTLVATGTEGGSVWNFATEWKLERTLGTPEAGGLFPDRVTALDFSPDGKTLAVGSGEPSRSGEIKLFDLETGKPTLTFKEPHSDTVNCLSFSPDGKQLASCAADRFVKLWNVADGKFVRSFEGHTHHVLGVSWRADGRVLVSSGADMVLKVWDTRTGDQLRTVQNQFTKEVTCVSFVADDMVVASGGDSKVRFINATNGSSQRDFGGTTEYMYSVAASGDGKTIIAGGLDSVVRLWADDGKELAKFTPPAPPKDQTAAK
jgi:WD40 repeat protein